MSPIICRGNHRLLGFLLGFLLLSAPIGAAEFSIALLGSFNDRAVFIVDGKRELLAVGESSTRGFTLVSLTTTSAVIELNGERSLIHMGARTSADGGSPEGSAYSTAPPRPEVKILPDRRGMYYVRGRINGVTVKFLVDTGATTIALNAGMAKRLGIDYLEGESRLASTASGVVTGYVVNLSSVEVGTVSVPNVEAMVMDGGFPADILLGNSFLEKLEMVRNGKVMTLRRKW